MRRSEAGKPMPWRVQFTYPNGDLSRAIIAPTHAEALRIAQLAGSRTRVRIWKERR